MPSSEQFVENLLELPLIRGLRTCAQRLRMRFALRGGILRNMLFRLDTISDSSLYDFVDPFSDIDLVVEGESDWPQLAQVIAESLPFAAFHRWEAETEVAVQAASKRFGMIPADRLLLWIDGKREKVTSVSLSGLDVKADSVVQQPEITLESSWFQNKGNTGNIGQLLDVLRLTRYVFANPGIRSAIEPTALFERLGFREMSDHYPRVKSAQFSLDVRRLELAILDLLFTAAHWRDAAAFLEICRKEIPPVWLESSRLLSRIFYQSFFSAGNGIGAVLYKPGPASSLRTVLFNDSRPVPNVLRAIDSIIPWIKLQSSGHNPTECCGYTDFQNGVATVAWRGKENNLGFSKLKESQYATVALPSAPRSTYARAESKIDQGLISVPGFVRKGQSLVIRLDHGYVRAFVNRNVSFRLGLVPSKYE